MADGQGGEKNENFGYAVTDVNRTAYGSGGRLCKLDVPTGNLTVLVDDHAGAIRDPQVDYDATKILFSYRKAGSRHFHLYEVNSDGSYASLQYGTRPKACAR